MYVFTPALMKKLMYDYHFLCLTKNEGQMEYSYLPFNSLGRILSSTKQETSIGREAEELSYTTERKSAGWFFSLRNTAEKQQVITSVLDDKLVSAKLGRIVTCAFETCRNHCWDDLESRVICTITCFLLLSMTF
jgi:hypothetical protein